MACSSRVCGAWEGAGVPGTRPRSGRDHTLNFLCTPALQAAGLLAFLMLSAQVWIAAEARVYTAWDGQHLQQAGPARTSLKANKAINYVDQVGLRRRMGHSSVWAQELWCCAGGRWLRLWATRAARKTL